MNEDRYIFGGYDLIVVKKILGGNSSDRAMLSFVSGLKCINEEEVEVLETILFNSTRKFSATHVRLA